MNPVLGHSLRGIALNTHKSKVVSCFQLTFEMVYGQYFFPITLLQLFILNSTLRVIEETVIV